MGLGGWDWRCGLGVVIPAFSLLTPLRRPLLHPAVFEFMPYMGITLATIFTMLRLVNEAKMRQVICSGTCPTGASGVARAEGWRGRGVRCGRGRC